MWRRRIRYATSGADIGSQHVQRIDEELITRVVVAVSVDITNKYCWCFHFFYVSFDFVERIQW